MRLVAGAPFRLDLDASRPGDAARTSLPHPEIFAALKPGAELLLDDGKLRLKVEASGPDFAETTVVNGGMLSEETLMLPAEEVAKHMKSEPVPSGSRTSRSRGVG